MQLKKKKKEKKKTIIQLRLDNSSITYLHSKAFPY